MITCIFVAVSKPKQVRFHKDENVLSAPLYPNISFTQEHKNDEAVLTYMAEQVRFHNDENVLSAPL